MKDIKTKEKLPKTIKKLNKVNAWKERIKDPIISLKNKTDNLLDNDSDVVDYGEEKIKYVTNRTKDEVVYFNGKGASKVGRATKNKIKDRFVSKEVINPNNMKNNKLKNKIFEKGKQLAISGTKKTKNYSKKIGKATISSIKSILASLKSLIALLIAGGSLALIGIIVVSLIASLCSSIFGIFFSSESVNTIPMSEAIVKINDKMDDKIKQIETMNPHDEIVIDSNKAEWKDILAIYSVKVSNGSNQYDVMTLDDNKLKILEDVFWDMNEVNYDLKTENYIPEVIGNLGYMEEPVQEIMQKQVLRIHIKGKSLEEMKRAYMFSQNQFAQLDELTSKKYAMLWNNAIYGMYSSNGDFTKWRQSDSSWSSIKIGSSDKTLGDIGCLITSVSILIKKSNVDTNSIYPFNPGTFTIALNNNYGFDKNGNLQYSAINKVVPNFKYEGYVKLKDKSKSEKISKIKEYHDKGYYISIEVKGATKDNEHWVALDNINSNSILMIDPASNKIDMWNKYDWNNTSGFTIFKSF